METGAGEGPSFFLDQQDLFWEEGQIPCSPLLLQMGRFTALLEGAGAKYTFEVMAEYTQVSQS